MIIRALKRKRISIHAPSRERQSLSAGRISALTFQSTLPRGSDIQERRKSYCLRHFNPRSLAGATCRHACVLRQLRHFNPRSLAGATTLFVCSIVFCTDFNPRSLAGATYDAGLRHGTLAQFQSTLPRGSDHLLPVLNICCSDFNPRSLAGATANQPKTGALLLYFNPRSLAGATVYGCSWKNPC